MSFVNWFPVTRELVLDMGIPDPGEVAEPTVVGALFGKPMVLMPTGHPGLDPRGLGGAIDEALAWYAAMELEHMLHGDGAPSPEPRGFVRPGDYEEP